MTSIYHFFRSTKSIGVKTLHVLFLYPFGAVVHTAPVPRVDSTEENGKKYLQLSCVFAMMYRRVFNPV